MSGPTILVIDDEPQIRRVVRHALENGEARVVEAATGRDGAVVARTRWHWPMWRVAALTAFFLAFDLAFLGANALKIRHGGWVPLLIAAAILTVMMTWKTGRDILTGIMRQSGLPLDLLLEELGRRSPPRVPGTAVFLTSDAEGAPVVLLHHLKHNKALHTQVVLLSVVAVEVPDIDDAERVRVTTLPHGFFRVVARYGFMETPNVPHVLALCEPHGVRTKPMETSYYLGRERLLPTGGSRMARWRKKLFVFMSRNAQSAANFFGLPPNRVVELGAQIEFGSATHGARARRDPQRTRPAGRLYRSRTVALSASERARTRTLGAMMLLGSSVWSRPRR
jgi:KUP system potassium uptake protein